MSLKLQTFAAVRWTAAGSITKAILQVGQIAVLARILSPEDFGLMAIVIAILGFAAIFSDFGVNSAFVHCRDVTDLQRNSLFWFNVLVSGCLMLLIMALSPLLSIFFRDERLTLLIIISSTTFMFNSVGIQVRMAAEKALLFRGVMLVEVWCALVGFATAVWAALVGLGVISLVLGAVVNAFLSMLLFWLFLSKGWRPKLEFRLNEVRSFIGFGSLLVANNIVNQINLTIDLVLGGRMLAASQLGLYSIPRDLVLRVQGVVNPIATRVAFPLIAEVQCDIDRVRKIYLQALNMTASTNAPIYIGVAFFSNELVALLFGHGWGESAQILQVLALWGALRSIGNPSGSLLLGMGRADLSLRWNLGLLVITPPVIWFGSLHGHYGIALALLSLSITLFVPGWLIIVKPLCKVSLTEFSITALRPLFISALTVTPAYAISSNLDGSTLRLSVGLLISLPIYLILSYFFNKEWASSVFQLVRFQTH